MLGVGITALLVAMIAFNIISYKAHHSMQAGAVFFAPAASNH